ncbi:MAG: hypothetical protein WC957_00945 [Candidatus Neomarinimicrobiota bacterium]|jgi:hypothetical protein
MRNKPLIGFIFGCLITGIACNLAFGQSNLPADLSDSYFTDDELDIDELQELIYAYQDNPLLWETCKVKDLRILPLSDHLKSRLIDLKRHHPKFLDWQVLQSDTVFTIAELDAIRLFINFEKAYAKSGQMLHYISLRKQENATNLQKSLQRVRYNTRQGWFGGLVLENDRDEPRIWDYRNFSLRSPQYFNRLDLWGGAYRLQWGQGLLFSNNLMSGRSTNVVGNLNPSRAGFGNYLGADENRYLFGVAAKLSIAHFNLYQFYSRHFLDASVNQNGIVTNLRSDGLHISSSQLQAKDALTEKLAGVSLMGGWRSGSAGILVYTADYSRGMEALYGHQTISGVSFLHNCELQDWAISGEIAVQNNGSQAIVENFSLYLDQLSLGAGWRYFSPDFFAPLGSPFKKFGGTPANESGFYSGLKIKLPDRWYCGAYVDFFREIEGSRTGTPAQNGMEALFGVSHSAKAGGIFEVWYKTTRYYHVALNSKPRDYQLKFHLRHSFNPKFTGEIRATIRWHDSTNFAESGQAVGLVGRMGIAKNTRLVTGLTHFYVKTSDLIVYFYEPGLPAQFNLNNLTGTGRRYFLIITQRIGQSCELAGALRVRIRSPISNDDPNFEISGDLQLTFDL